MAFSDYSTTPSANVSINGINVGEGCAPANINDALRQLMADAKTFANTALTSNTAATITGVFTHDANLRFNDGVFAVFGTGTDMTIQHDGSHSYIKHAGPGNLVVQSSNNILLQNEDLTETFAQFVEDGAATLYYDNAAKLATATGGVSVTGNVTLTTDIMITEAADHTSTPAAGKLILWVKNDTPNILKYTDDAGTDFTVATATSVSAAITAANTAERFTSTAQTITAGGTLTLPHGLGAAPTIVTAWLVNVTGEHGYTTGQKVALELGAQTSSRGVSVIFGNTNLVVRFGSAAASIAVVDASTGDNASITNANWTIVFHARL
jgi:hypothetical protein